MARAYSADKNMAIYLGRPPRILRKYCRYEVLGQITQDLPNDPDTPLPWQLDCPEDKAFDYMADTSWSAICARLKEEALDLQKEADMDVQIHKAKSVRQSTLTEVR